MYLLNAGSAPHSGSFYTASSVGHTASITAGIFFSDDLNPDVPPYHCELVSTTSSPSREFRYVMYLLNSYSLSLTIPLIAIVGQQRMHWGFGTANQSPPKTEWQPSINELMSSVGKPLPLLEHIVPLTMLHLKVVKALLNLTDASSDDVGTLHSICAQHNDSRGYWVPDSKQKCQHLFLKMDFMSLRLCYHFLTKKYM